jgi:hypothetical protein
MESSCSSKVITDRQVLEFKYSTFDIQTLGGLRLFFVSIQSAAHTRSVRI